jgi:hypothetical protein
MRKYVLLCLLMFLFQFLSAQVVAYVGTVQQSRAEVLIERVSASNFRGTLIFSQTDVPLQLESGFVMDYQYRSPLNLMVTRGTDTLGSLYFPRFDPTELSATGLFKPKDPKAAVRPFGFNRSFVLNFCERTPAEGLSRYEWTQGIEVDSFYFRVNAERPVGSICASIVALQVKKKKTDQLIQEISGLDQEIRHCTTLEKGDYNFDGHLDFRILRETQKGSENYHSYYLYKPQSKTFEPEKSLDPLPSVETDTKKKILISTLLNAEGQPQVSKHRWNPKTNVLEEQQ